MKDLVFQWRDSLKRRTGIDYDTVLKQSPELDESWGIIIGRR